MTKVYVSSTRLDLEAQRQAIFEWLVARGHQPVHSYTASGETVRDSCVADVGGCDAYVLILGHRLGHVPEQGNAEGLSITELEHREALRLKLPVVALKLTSIGNIALTDVQQSARYARVLAFHRRVDDLHRAAECADLAQLISGLSTGLEQQLRTDPLLDPKVQRIIAGLQHATLDKDDRIAALEREVQALRAAQQASAIARTLQRAEAPGATAAATHAARSLEQGDSRPAEALLRVDEAAAVERAQQASGSQEQTAARRQAAALARERGALAFGHDATAALAAYREALEHEPDDVWSWYFVGDLELVLGSLAGALVQYQSAARLTQARVTQDPANTGWQRDLSVSHEKMGQVLVDQGDLPAALEAFQASLGIRQTLAARDPANTDWQRDLSVSHNKIGDVLVAQGDLPAALAAFQADLGIAQTLAAHDPANTGWQRDLSVSHNKIGDVLVAQGDLPAALAAFQASLVIRQTLAARDPANTEWQRDLSVSRNKIGDVLVAQGDLPAALEVFQAGRGIAQTLAARDPANTEWQRDLSVSHVKIGDVLVDQRDLPAALAAFHASLGIARTLAARDPANTGWQRDLSVSHNKIGNVLLAQGDLPAALTAFQAGLGIAQTLAARDPANVQWRLDVVVSSSKLATHPSTEPARALALLKEGLDTLEELHAAGRLPPSKDWRDWFRRQLDARRPPAA